MASRAGDQRLMKALYDFLSDNGAFNLERFQRIVESHGIRHEDYRLRKLVQELKSAANHPKGIAKDLVMDLLQENTKFVTEVFREDLVVRNFRRFTKKIDKIYELCKSNKDGGVATYIPELANVDPNLWGVALCTVDGQRYSIGDSKVGFSIQSASKPLTYAMVSDALGSDYVHKYVGREPSGESFNKIKLDSEGRPHNPLINPGAIMISSIVLGKENKQAESLARVQHFYRRLAGHEYVGFDNDVYQSERKTADRNFALGYYMRENKCFPPGTDLLTSLDLYFQLCSIEINCETGSVIAATLANGGICPITGERVLRTETVRNTLSLMHSCGMYDYAGNFAFEVGLPAKSGVSGVVLLVVPNVMGVATYSPRLEEHGNSLRGLQFSEELVDKFNFHMYDSIRNTEDKDNPLDRDPWDTPDMDADDDDNVISMRFGDTSRMAEREDDVMTPEERRKWMRFLVRTNKIH